MGFVDHTPYETTSILRFIERRWGLAPLGARDAAAGDLTTAFDFSRWSAVAATSCAFCRSSPVIVPRSAGGHWRIALAAGWRWQGAQETGPMPLEARSPRLMAPVVESRSPPGRAFAPGER